MAGFDVLNDPDFEHLGHEMQTEEDNQQDEGAWLGVENSVSDPVAGTFSQKDSSRVPPSRDELRTIQNAVDLFRNSTFKLQVDALLPTVRAKQARKAPLERFLLYLHEFIMSLPVVEPVPPLRGAEMLASPSFDQSTQSKSGSSKPQFTPVAVHYSLPLPNEATNWKVAFASPSDIALVGSWATDTAVRGRDGAPFGVDIAVEMPLSLFQEKDYLNGRFFQKRAYYLACLASAFIHSDSLSELVTVSYSQPSFDTRLTELVLRCRPNGGNMDFTKLNAEIRIIPVLSNDSPIPISRLSPSHSNLRVAEAKAASADGSPSPTYNNALLAAFSLRRRLLTVHRVKSEVPAFNDALTLLRVWANQRGYGCSTASLSCLAGFEHLAPLWSTILELVIFGEDASSKNRQTTAPRRPLGKGLSSYQLFKASIDLLAHHDFSSGVVTTRNTDGTEFTSHDYEGYNGPVFIDGATSVNLLAGVPISSLDLLRHDARVTLDALNSSSETENVFKDVFLQDHRALAARFDIVLRVNIHDLTLSISPHALLEAGSQRNALVSILCRVLKQGLGTRAKAIAVMSPPPSLCSVTTGAINLLPSWLAIGVILDSEHAYRLVDYGPAAAHGESPEIHEFRSFWGDKAELRRFKDGRILESVVWEAKSTDDRLHVPTAIIQHLLHRHAGVSPSDVISWQPEFDSMIRLPTPVTDLYSRNGIQGGFRPALLAFQDLVKLLKSMDNEFPIGILGISPASSILRQTSVFAPVPVPPLAHTSVSPQARYLPCMDIIVQFEKAGQWPDDLQAIQKVKLAFFEQMASALLSKLFGASAKIVLERGASPIADHASLQVVTPAGWAFNVRIHHDREATLLDQIIDDRSHIIKRKVAAAPADPAQAKKRRQAQRALVIHRRRFVHAPANHRAVSQLASRFPAFPGTARLVKRWFASHWLLGGHVVEEAVELVTAMVFLHGGQHGFPNTRERGFVATMMFIRDWAWEEGLVVPIYELDVDYAEEPVGSSATSESSSSAAWRLVTKMDPEGKVWTAEGPDAVVARRIQVLAKATCEALSRLDHGELSVKSLFTHPTEDYDVLIKLDPVVLPRYAQSVDFRAESLGRRRSFAQSGSTQLVDFDPARLFRENLQSIYRDTFKAFHDHHGGATVGLVWDPSIRQPRPFRVMNNFSSKPTVDEPKAKNKGLVTLNESSVLAEIARLGEDMITAIVKQT